MHFLDVGRVSHIDDGLTFIRIGFNSFICQHSSKELLESNHERTLDYIQAHVILSS